jgi:hypothetical protein
MSTPEHTEDTEENRDTALADPDDYHRRQRLKEIHKARQRVGKTMGNLDEAPKRGVGEEQRRELAYAASLYVAELEPIIEDTDADDDLPDNWPWDTLGDFADNLGRLPDDHHLDTQYLPKANTMKIYRICNQILADVKPLIEDEETTEWEV